MKVIGVDIGVANTDLVVIDSVAGIMKMNSFKLSRGLGSLPTLTLSLFI